MQDHSHLYLNFINEFNLKEDEILFLSSDVSQLAKYFKSQGTSFDPNILIDLLQRRLSNGTIIIPAFTDLLKNGEEFDWNKSKPTTGALSNRVMRRKDFIRTEDVLHSVFVWGKHQTEILELQDESTFGPKSIFGFMEHHLVKNVIIDVHFQNSFTYVHYIEEKRKVNYRKAYYWTVSVRKNGEVSSKKVLFYTKKWGIETNLTQLQDQLISKGIVKHKIVEGISLLILDVAETGRETENFLNNGGKTHEFKLFLWFKCFVKVLIGRK
jgi:aminoglycoside 3-N-acetyltransferase